ncbi:MAG: hypothetical protein WCR20_13785, partial [Verrucomicrobiota bacterium]
MIVYYSADYVAAKYAFDTTRKSAEIMKSLITDPIPGVLIQPPPPLASHQLELAHTAQYIDAVRTGEPEELATSNGFGWCEKMYQMVRASNGGVVAAAEQALKDRVSGTLSSGLHHARRDGGGGFCTFNGLAIAALDVIERKLVDRVVIIDFDAHYGNGTEDIIGKRPDIRLIDVTPGMDGKKFLPECASALYSLEGEQFGLAIYNAGMDPFERCSIGGREGITKETLAVRERLVFEFCHKQRWPVA